MREEESTVWTDDSFPIFLSDTGTASSLNVSLRHLAVTAEHHVQSETPWCCTTSQSLLFAGLSLSLSLSLQLLLFVVKLV